MTDDLPRNKSVASNQPSGHTEAAVWTAANMEITLNIVRYLVNAEKLRERLKC